MYDPMRQQFYDLVMGLITMLTNGGLWSIVGPFVIMGLVVYFIRWSRAKATGERLDTLVDEVQTSVRRTQTAIRPEASRRASPPRSRIR